MKPTDCSELRTGRTSLELRVVTRATIAPGGVYLVRVKTEDFQPQFRSTHYDDTGRGW